MPLPTTPTRKGRCRAINLADSPYAAVPATPVKNSRRRIVSSFPSSVVNITVRSVWKSNPKGSGVNATNAYGEAYLEHVAKYDRLFATLRGQLPVDPKIADDGCPPYGIDCGCLRVSLMVDPLVLAYNVSAESRRV
jgi:hypothetical protein